MGEGEWETGLLMCCAAPGGVQACCLGFCCTGVLFGLNVEKLNRPDDCVLGGSCVGAGCVWYAADAAGCWCVPQCIARGAVRRRHGIESSALIDCLVTTLCCCCAAIQEYNQLHAPPPPPASPALVSTRNSAPATNSMRAR